MPYRDDEGGRQVRYRKRYPYPLETSLPGLFAAGDVRVRSAAVGEGAQAVSLVHRFLAER